jgi:uncharacterized Zn finger protein (UPF0148 family)
MPVVNACPICGRYHYPECGKENQMEHYCGMCGMAVVSKPGKRCSSCQAAEDARRERQAERDKETLRRLEQKPRRLTDVYPEAK